jgi:hypothetical protein
MEAANHPNSTISLVHVSLKLYLDFSPALVLSRGQYF